MTGQGWAGLAALAAALSYAVGAVAQQRAAGAAAASRGVSGRRSLAWLFTRPLWLAGVALDGAGFVWEFIALRDGSLTLVQPLLVSGLLFAMPLGAVVARRQIRGRDFGAAALVCAGLAVALGAAHPKAGSGPAPTMAWLTVSAATTAVVGALLLTGRRRSPATRAVCWAAASGVVNGLFAGLAKAVGVSWRSGWVALLGGWPLWALLVAAGSH